MCQCQNQSVKYSHYENYSTQTCPEIWNSCFYWETNLYICIAQLENTPIKSNQQAPLVRDVLKKQGRKVAQHEVSQ